MIIKCPCLATVQETHAVTSTYVYDTANRLIEVDGVSFIWDDNGNLIQDDTRIYGYDYANRLTFVLMDGDTYNFSYNGLGDRLGQTVNGMPTSYWLDLGAGLTQVLSDGMNAYLYGMGRIGEEQPSGWQFYLGDALGSVRQLVDVSNGVGAGMAYEPFGDNLVSTGVANSVYGFTGEWADTGLVHLRARYYEPIVGRFISPDLWWVDPYKPLSLNQWNYVASNPINFTDPSGMYLCAPSGCCAWITSALVRLETSSGPFSHLVVDIFDKRDRKGLPVLVLFVIPDALNIAMAPIGDMILLPRRYLGSGASPTNDQIGIFAHETVHISQRFPERVSVWAEAQAFIYEGKVIEELGSSPRGFIKDITLHAFDPSEPGYTTRDLSALCRVRHILVSQLSLYGLEPTIWDFLVFPTYYSYCNPP